jgi:hypothetical protein
MAARPQIHLAVALDGAGWHPAAWREPDAVAAAELFSPRPTGSTRSGGPRPGCSTSSPSRTDSRSSREAGSPGSDERTDQVRGRLDASLIAARVAPLTSAHRHRADDHHHAHRALPRLQDHRHARLREHRPGRLAGAGRRPGRGGRAVRPPRPARRARLEHLDTRRCRRRSRSCSTRRPTTWRSCAGSGTAGRTTPRSATPRPAGSSTARSCTTSTSPGPVQRARALDHAAPAAGPAARRRARARTIPYRFAARSADVALITPHDVDASPADRAEIRAGAGRGRARRRAAARLRRVRGLPRRDPAAAIERKERLDEAAGAPYRSDAPVFAGTPGALADQLAEWAEAGLDGFRLRPGRRPARPRGDHRRAGAAVAGARKLFRREYEADTLRGLLGFERPANRYAAAIAA